MYTTKKPRGWYLINLLPIFPDCLFETLEKQSLGIDSDYLKRIELGSGGKEVTKERNSNLRSLSPKDLAMCEKMKAFLAVFFFF